MNGKIAWKPSKDEKNCGKALLSNIGPDTFNNNIIYLKGCHTKFTTWNANKIDIMFESKNHF